MANTSLTENHALGMARLVYVAMMATEKVLTSDGAALHSIAKTVRRQIGEYTYGELDEKVFIRCMRQFSCWLDKEAPSMPENLNAHYAAYAEKIYGIVEQL